MVAAVMEEICISLQGQMPTQITHAMVDNTVRNITMGCGVDADACRARILVTEDWGPDDPKEPVPTTITALNKKIMPP